MIFWFINHSYSTKHTHTHTLYVSDIIICLHFIRSILSSLKEKRECRHEIQKEKLVLRKLHTQKSSNFVIAVVFRSFSFFRSPYLSLSLPPLFARIPQSRSIDRRKFIIIARTRCIVKRRKKMFFKAKIFSWSLHIIVETTIKGSLHATIIALESQLYHTTQIQHPIMQMNNDEWTI